MESFTKEELKDKIEQFLKNVNEAVKFKLNSDKLSYLGYQISKDGISPDGRLNNRISECPFKETNRKLIYFSD